VRITVLSNIASLVIGGVIGYFVNIWTATKSWLKFLRITHPHATDNALGSRCEPFAAPGGVNSIRNRRDVQRPLLNPYRWKAIPLSIFGG
jgi:hypothetical protein